MTTLIASPAMLGICAARSLIGELISQQEMSGRACFPQLDAGSCWTLVRYGNDAQFWHVGMIQLMARARRENDRDLWHFVGYYLINEASPAQLQPDVLRIYEVQSPLRWMSAQVRNVAYRLRKAAQQANQPADMAEAA
jgi:hypothetical protein